MVRVNRFIALAAVLALSLFAAQATFAGPGGSAGDSFTIVGEGLGGLTKLWTTDPLGGGLTDNDFEYQLFGPPDAEYLFCASWVEAGGLEVPVAVKQVGNTWAFFSKYNGQQTEFRYFGNASTDTPTVMDYDGNGTDDIVVVRNAGPALQWIVRNAVTDEESSVADTFLFGPADATPAPGNWDGEVTPNDQAAVTTEGTGGSKLWQWQDGAGGVGVALFGRSVDANIPYTSNGQTRPGVARIADGANMYIVTTAVEVEYVQEGPESSQPVGNCNL